MPITNLIMNGDFNLGNTGWSGTDMETSYNEHTYLGNGNTGNHVAEMDGNSNQITVMYQIVDITTAGTFPLEFRTALRQGQPVTNGEGFRVDVYDEHDNVIFSQHIYPTTQNWESFSLDITFPVTGPYKISFTELGVNNSLGAIIDDIGLLVCFAAGTMIGTPEGPRPVESLEAGDLVLTRDSGAMPLKWIGSRLISASAQKQDQTLCPVVFEPDSLGEGLPQRRLAVSPQHRMLISGWKAELWFGESEVLVPAISLVNDSSIRQAAPESDVTYVHFLLDGHQIVLAEGCLSESFHPGDHSLQGLETAARDEVLQLFPELRSEPVVAARPVVRRKLAAVLNA